MTTLPLGQAMELARENANLKEALRRERIHIENLEREIETLKAAVIRVNRARGIALPPEEAR